MNSADYIYGYPNQNSREFEPETHPRTITRFGVEGVVTATQVPLPRYALVPGNVTIWKNVCSKNNWRGVWNKALSDFWCNVKFSLSFTTEYKEILKENLVIYQKSLKAFLQAPLQLEWPWHYYQSYKAINNNEWLLNLSLIHIWRCRRS